ncbi:hypothetical protein N7512_009626 [Penicillium capsulatum]|nr:hypothetical protein N7512_009626 [Penicillium capsulatum]
MTTTTTTTPPTYIPRGPTSASLTFYAPPARQFCAEIPHEVSINDIRNAEQNYNLDKDAFQTLQNTSTKTTYETFDSDSAVREVYYPEVEQLLLTTLPGAHKIVLFDHTIRRQKDGAPRQPVTRAHVDQTPRAAADRVRLHISDPEEAETLLRGRYRIVNVWKALTDEPVQSAPLAFASADSVEAEDLVPIQHRYPHRVGETMGVKYNPSQRWLYWSGMTDDERLLLKCSDSWGLEGREGVRQWVPHTAFWDPRTPEGARARESIEVRALVFG